MFGYFNFLNYIKDEKIIEKIKILAWVINPKESNILNFLDVNVFKTKVREVG